MCVTAKYSNSLQAVEQPEDEEPEEGDIIEDEEPEEDGHFEQKTNKFK